MEWKGFTSIGEYEYKIGEIFKGKVIIYDYFNHELFEGEYKNFEKYNGKLIEYFDDINHIVKRVIEIKEGNKTGKGKEYYGNEKLKYIGTYVDGKRDGKGKEFYEFFGYIKYEGEFKNDERHGFGKESDKQGNLLYEGEYSFGKRKEN